MSPATLPAALLRGRARCVTDAWTPFRCAARVKPSSLPGLTGQSIGPSQNSYALWKKDLRRRRKRSFRADAQSKKRPYRNGDPHVVLVNTLFWKVLVTRVK